MPSHAAQPGAGAGPARAFLGLVLRVAAMPEMRKRWRFKMASQLMSGARRGRARHVFPLKTVELHLGPAICVLSKFISLPSHPIPYAVTNGKRPITANGE